MSYTKGPWFNKGYEIQANGCSVEIAKVTVFNQGKANANLMAAAPELLEALQDCLDSLGNEFNLPEDVQDAARFVIAKAKGETNE